jgi:HNH endonuclease
MASTGRGSEAQWDRMQMLASLPGARPETVAIVRAREEGRRRADAAMWDLGLTPSRGSVQTLRAELRADRSVAFRVFQRDGYRCIRCGTDGTEPRNDLTVDHVVALSRGGDNGFDNLQTLCRSCNASKGAA